MVNSDWKINLIIQGEISPTEYPLQFFSDQYCVIALIFDKKSGFYD